ncbi:MAG: magnesium transporter CorA family protein [Anaerolineaceae bacterium]|nr:magnesium transporter CorA family protein [Anaerolineaceae bacterium]MBN2677630.1 magnesium transporter CorA family protein [Anaerolineaceae bacterium]
MIKFYKQTDNGITTLSKQVSGCWIRCVDPTAEEVEYLVNLGLPHDFITYSLDQDERPRIEREDDGTRLIILRIPIEFEANADIPFDTIPMGIITTDNYIVTVCKFDTNLLDDFINGKSKNFSTAKRNRMLLLILLRTATRYLNHLRQIDKNVDLLEDQLTLSMRNKELLELLKYQKSLVYFTTALKANQLILEHLNKTHTFRAYEEDEDLLEDVITENQQAIEMTTISNGILSSMMDAFASMISNNLNVVMKFLASITIVLSIPTIVTSFYGMNVVLPFANNPLAYLIIIGIFVVICLFVIYLFIRRDWF